MISMNLIVLSDIHSQIQRISNLEQELKLADLVLLSGDMTEFGNYKSAELVFSEIKKYNNKYSLSLETAIQRKF